LSSPLFGSQEEISFVFKYDRNSWFACFFFELFDIRRPQQNKLPSLGQR